MNNIFFNNIWGILVVCSVGVIGTYVGNAIFGLSNIGGTLFSIFELPEGVPLLPGFTISKEFFYFLMGFIISAIITIYIFLYLLTIVLKRNKQTK